MNIVIDTNIALDIALKRYNLFESSFEAISIAISQGHHLFFLSSSVTDFYYILKKNNISKENAFISIKNLAIYASFATVDENIIYEALQSNVDDFEDAVVDEVAKSINADYILTRNKKDFLNSYVKAITPEEYIRIQ